MIEDLDMRKLSAKWVPKFLNAEQTPQRCQSSKQYWKYFAVIQMISCRVWWPWTKHSYFTMTQEQSNNQWSGGIGSHPAPKFSECKHPLEIFSPRCFWDKDGILLIEYLPKDQTMNAEYYLSLLVKLKDILKEKRRAAEKSPGGSCSCTTMPRITGHLQPRRNWPTWASNVLITHPILRIWPRRTTTCSVDWKKRLKVRHFSSDAEVIAAAETWLDGQLSEFFNGLQS